MLPKAQDKYFVGNQLSDAKENMHRCSLTLGLTINRILHVYFYIKVLT